MHYVYFLEGLLKNETINFDNDLTFVLYTDANNLNNEELNEETEDDGSIFYLKSETDVKINLNLTTEKLSAYGSSEITGIFIDKEGKEEDFQINNTFIDLSDKIKKITVPDIGFSFLVNTLVDPQKLEVKYEISSAGVLSKIKNNKFTLPIFGAGICIVMLFVFFNMLSNRETKKVVLFENEMQLMKANLKNYSRKDIVVKTELRRQIEKVLEEVGIKYIRFELISRLNKYELMLYIFPNSTVNDQSSEIDVNSILKSNNINWVKSVSTLVLEPKGMLSDFNILAKKYNLTVKKLNSKLFNYELVDINLPNNNLRYKSIQEDLGTFYNRWGKNYIEFNVNLEERQKTPIDFIIKNGNETIIKTGQGYYFN